VYESDAGFEVLVATSRYVFESEPAPAPERTAFDTDEAFVDALFAWQVAVSAAVDAPPLAPIGGPYDGQTRTFGTGGEAADWLEVLTAAGYLFPAGVVEDLRAEDEQDVRSPVEKTLS
jgi:hypothetical protein